MNRCPRPLDCTDTYGSLVIGTTSLSGGAWCAYDLSALGDTLDVQGENVATPWLPGAEARGLLDAETVIDLPLMFSGATDQANVPWDNHAGGLLANRQALVDALIAPIRDGTSSSFVAVWTRPDPDDVEGTVDWEAEMQPLGLTGWELLPIGYARADLTLAILAPWEESE